MRRFGPSAHLLAASAGMALLLSAAPARAQTTIVTGPPGDWVLDRVGGVISPDERLAIQRVLFALQRDTGAEVGVLVEAAPHDETASELAHRVFSAWRIGKADLSNGVLLLYLCGQPADQVEIAAGTGYRTVLDAAWARGAVDASMRAPIAAGRRGEAIVAGVRAIAVRLRVHHARPEPPGVGELGAGALAFPPFGGGERLPDAPPGLPPAPRDYVLDRAGVLSPAERLEVVGTIFALERETSAEIGVLIDRTCGQEAPAAFAVRVFNAWGIGKRERNNGVLLLLLVDDRAVEITPGHGYRDLLNAATAGAILDQVVVPHLREQRRSRAVVEGVQRIAQTIRAHEGAAPAAPGAPPSGAVFAGFGGGIGREAPAEPAAAAFPAAPASGSGAPFPWICLVCGAPLLLLGIVLARPRKCPRCQKPLSVTSRTLVAASYTSSGRGESTEHCDACGYHNVSVYTIPIRSQHVHRSSSSSGGGGSSKSFSSKSSSSRGGFGGGRSSGGGAGRRW